MRLNVIRFTCSITGTHGELVEGESDLRKMPAGWIGLTYRGESFDVCPDCIVRIPAFIASLPSNKKGTVTVQVQPQSVADQAKALSAGEPT